MAKPTKEVAPIFPDEFDECFRKIGQYMFHWACIESALNRLITTAMKLGSTEGVIVCANMQVRDKLYIAETAIALQSKPETWRAAAKKTIRGARTHSEDRNRVAHNFFAPEGGKAGSIRFFIRKAKGKLEFPETVWTSKQYLEKLHAMVLLAEDIERIAKEITPKPADLIGGLHALGSYADFAREEPKRARGLLSLALEANRPSQEAPRRLDASHPPTARTPAGPDPLAGFWEDWIQQNSEAQPTPETPKPKARRGTTSRPKAAKKAD